jgi:hypothetical protein
LDLPIRPFCAGIALLLEQPQVPQEFLQEFCTTALHLAARRSMCAVEFVDFVKEHYPNMTQLMDTGEEVLRMMRC